MRHLTLRIFLLGQMTLLSVVLGIALIRGTLLTLQLQLVAKGGLKRLVLGWLALVMIHSSSSSLLMGQGNAHFACKFFFSFSSHIFTDNFHRKLHQNNGAIRVHRYAESTASGPLRSHLLTHHAEEWVQECQQQNIALRGKGGEEALAKVTGVPVDHQAEARVPFTQENFLDGLVQFVVATDQVFLFFSFVFGSEISF
jgi:hypothetical protein